MRLARLAVAAVLVAGCGATSGDAGEGGAAPSREQLSSDVRAGVTLAGMRPHLRALQRIADANGGNRAAGLAGYRASVEYVRTELARAGYRVRTPAFPFLRFIEQVERARRVGPRARTFAVEALEYSGSTPRAGLRLRAIQSGDGCQPSDFPRAVRGQIALVQRGACFFAIKARNASGAGARAAVVVNNERGRLDATLVSPISIPVVAVTRDVGATLAGTRIELIVRTRVTRMSVQNVIADVRGAQESPVLMAGGHLDSVAAGAGINDNGSGVAALLEIAKSLIRLEPRHRVRFAFWAAEESGLHGSRAYVDSLANRAGVMGYLNFDMLGSKRYVRGVYRGPFQQVFERYFDARGLASDTIDITGRSDHAPFEERGIPTGGLYSGGDPCYHQRCDRVPNVRERALDELADAAAHAIVFLEPR